MNERRRALHAAISVTYHPDEGETSKEHLPAWLHRRAGEPDLLDRSNGMEMVDYYVDLTVPEAARLLAEKEMDFDTWENGFPNFDLSPVFCGYAVKAEIGGSRRSVTRLVRLAGMEKHFAELERPQQP